MPMQIRPAQNNAPSLRDFFGGFGAAPAPRPPGPPPAAAPRGRSAEGPPGFFSRF
jgi:hypothetical protein